MMIGRTISTLACEQGIIQRFVVACEDSVMPIYAYRCAECGHQDEHLQKMSADALTVCPACNAPKYEKCVTAAGFQLKGSGWYQTDFKGGKTAASSE
jgi:putative FmdB family regulatory protein